jgi:hypothetical protein
MKFVLYEGVSLAALLPRSNETLIASAIASRNFFLINRPSNMSCMPSK